MKKIQLKLIPLFTIFIMLVLIYISAVTQVKYFQNSGADAGIAETDTFDIGLPTGDDPWLEMEKIAAAVLSDNEQLDFSGTIRLIDDNGEKEKVVEEHPFTYSIYRDNYHYKLASTEWVNAKHYALVIDHETKKIGYAPNPANSQNLLFDLTLFKKMMTDRKADAKVTTLAGEKILTVDKIQDPSIQGYRVYYHPGSYHINKIVIGMVRLTPLPEEETGSAGSDNSGTEKEQHLEEEEQLPASDSETAGIEAYVYYVEIIFSRFNKKIIKPAEFNPGDRFITLKGNQPELKNEFSEYELIGATDN